MLLPLHLQHCEAIKYYWNFLTRCNVHYRYLFIVDIDFKYLVLRNIAIQENPSTQITVNRILFEIFMSVLNAERSLLESWERQTG